MRRVLALAALAGALWCQGRRDFLTEDEVDQIRLVQEPNERLKLYLKFARLRLELVKQTLAVDKPGRSRLIHDNLEDYVRIIEAVDTVIDDALARKLDVQKGVALVAEQEKQFLAALQELDARPARDRYLFEFILRDAIETTQDSLEESQHDLRARTGRVLEEDRRDKKKIEDALTVKDRQERQAAEQKQEEKARKVPTLRRKGEKAPEERR